MSTKDSVSHRLNFRLVHLLYVMAILASALATFGAPGLGLCVPILAVWVYVFTSPQRPRALAKAAIASIILYCLSSLLMVPSSAAREAARRTQCSSNLRHIAIALDAYHSTYGSLPPAYVADENGRPKHSWRVLILPFLGQQALYKSYDFDEPWDGPKNRKLASRMPSDYACPSDQRAKANSLASYMAVIGPRTCWPGAASRTFAEVTNDQAILVMEGPTRFNWLEPRDMSVNEATDLLTITRFGDNGGHAHNDFFYEYPLRYQVVFADGNVHQFRTVSREICEAVLTIDDGRSLPDFDPASPRVEVKRLKIGNCFQLGLFVLVVLWPLPWVWIHPAGDIAELPRASDVD